MNKYLGFTSAGFEFLLDSKNVIEVFDVDASQEIIGEVLVGKEGDAYWRGVLSTVVNMTKILGGNSENGHCYVVYKNDDSSEEYYILKVDVINSLYDFDEYQFSDIDLNDENLKKITNKVCLLEGSEQMILLVDKIENIFTMQA